MSIATIRRQVKNVGHNFSDTQVKVREATSNDPWGPSTGLMGKIADLSHNPTAFAEIMPIIWKRLNDHGKNWRKVYKSLILVDFLIKGGSEKVAAQCRENIYSIETLRDFQHVEEGRDQGMNVREKAKQMAALLQDEERLKNERTRFMLTRNRSKRSSGVGNETRSSTSAARHQLPTEYDEARPGSLGEEEMQMQIGSQDEETPKNERTRFMLTRNRFKQSSGVGHETRSSTSAARHQLPTENDEARPGSLGEEEMQMQICTAQQDDGRPENERTRFMLPRNRFKQSSGVGHETRSSTSAARHQRRKEEHEREEEKRKGEDVLYQGALEKSRKEAVRLSTQPNNTPFRGSTLPQATADRPRQVQPKRSTATPRINESWSPAPPTQTPPTHAPPTLYPSVPTPVPGILGNLAAIIGAQRTPPAASTANPFLLGSTAPAPVNPFAVNLARQHLLSQGLFPSVPAPSVPWSTPSPLSAVLNQYNAVNALTQSLQRNNALTSLSAALMQQNAALSNLTNLLGGTAPAASTANPFLLGSTAPAPVNPFTANQRKSPTLNEMRAGSTPTLIPQPRQTVAVYDVSSGESESISTNNRFEQSSGIGHETRSSISAARHQLHIEYDEARPASPGEEEMQMQICSSLQEEERLKNERTRFMLTRNRSKQSSGVGHETRSSTTAARHQLPAVRSTRTRKRPAEMDYAHVTSKQRKLPTENEMRIGSTPTIPPTGARTLLPQPLQPQPAPTNPFSGF